MLTMLWLPLFVCIPWGWAKEKPTSKGVTWANKRAILKIWSLAFLMKPAKCRFVL